MAKKGNRERRNRRQSMIPENMMEGKKNEISVANISISIPQPDPSTYPVNTDGQMVQSETGEAKDASDSFSGFIFMCNAISKPECFRYRVFGLPAGKRDVVEKIKTGMKLFLYDFDLKLLYGVYEASCNGQLNLEPYAFGGKYAAQVKFSIHKECLPLPERVLKRAIESNYHGFKFNQELSGFHVMNLMLSFRSLADVPPLPPIALDRQIRLPPPTDNSYHIRIQPNASLAINPYSPSIQQREIIQHQDLSGHHGTMLNHVPHTMRHLSLPVPPGNPYYEVNTRPTYLHGNIRQYTLDDPLLRVNERAKNTRLETHYPAVSYHQERGPYLQQPIGQVPQYAQGQGEREVGYQTKYSEAYSQVSQANASSHYGIPGHEPVSSYLQQPVCPVPQYAQGQGEREVGYQTKYSEYYSQVSQENASSHYGIPGNEPVSSYLQQPVCPVPQYAQGQGEREVGYQTKYSEAYSQVSQANTSSHYGIPGHEPVSSYLQQPVCPMPQYAQGQGEREVGAGITFYQTKYSEAYSQVSQANASSHYGIHGHEPVSPYLPSYQFQHGP